MTLEHRNIVHPRTINTAPHISPVDRLYLYLCTPTEMCVLRAGQDNKYI